MSFLPFIFFIVSALALLITFFSINPKKTAMETVNDMGIGYNLGNSFESFNISVKINNPDDQITLSGNEVPTKDLISNIKKYGFKTIRFPVTWMNFMDNNGNVNLDWMHRVKEVVNWIIKSNMYCILNVHHDGLSGHWLSEGIKSKDKFIYLWKQIANEFKNFNEHLIFESMNDVDYKIGENYDFITLLKLTQAFVDTIRNSGGKNGDRLLIISGASKELDYTCSSEYKMPIDPSNKLAISIAYDIPKQFAIEPDLNPWTYIYEDQVKEVPPMTIWGDENDYKEMFTSFEKMKEVFTSKKIPIIIVEVNILTEQKKDPDSIRKFLFSHFSMSSSYDGIMSCLWDTSNKKIGDMNHYDRKNDKWYDEKTRDNIKNISKGKFVRPTDFFIVSNIETIKTPNHEGNMRIAIGKRKVLKVIFNVNLKTDNLYGAGFGIVTNNKYGNRAQEAISCAEGELKNDGSYTYTVDVSKLDYNDYVQIEKWWGHDYIFYNYLTIEFEQSYTFFDYYSYIKNLS